MVEQVGTLVIGGGQAGIAMSAQLAERGVRHVVVERDRIAESWRTRRWDSLVANGPVWHDRLPGMTFPGLAADAFAPKDVIAGCLSDFAGEIAAPIRCGVEVTALARGAGAQMFRAETTAGVIEADHVVVATGPFQRPVVPALVPEDAGCMQLHSSEYRRPEQLPAGSVLVVGTGSSGVQIADELLRAGRRVFLSVGRHDRPPRRYRGKDFCWWLGALGKWDARVPGEGAEHVTIAVSGARGGHTVDLREFAERGMTLLGRVLDHREGVLAIEPDLAANLALGDANHRALLAEADAYIARHELSFPPEQEAWACRADPPCVTDPIRELDLVEEGVGAIVWATGYVNDFGWIDLDAFDTRGRPIHSVGVTAVPGLYFLGLPWLSRRASSFIWGVWADAVYLAEHIAARNAALCAADWTREEA